MMKGLSASLAMGLAVGQAPLSHNGTDDRYFEKEFESFMDRFDRKYSETEKPMRFLEFKRTFQLVASHNAKAKPYTMAVNKFADITLDEAKTMGLFGYNPKLANKKMAQQSVGVHSYDGAPLDSSVDWRTKGAVTPVKNQGQCGSCWAFSTIAGLEGAWFQATGSLISMSEQQLTDCEPDFQPDGCNGGLTYMALKWQEGQTICTEASYPYVSGGSGSATQCHGSCSTAIPQGGITGYKLVTASDENALASALMEHVVSVSIDASCDSFMNYGGGVYSDGCGTDVDHAVTAVGYASGYWIVKNSWGTRWGDSGYINMQRGQGGEGIAAILNAPVFPIVKGAPGPAPTPAPPTPGPPSPTPGPPAPTPGPPSPTPGPTPAPSSGNYRGPPCPADQVEASTGSGASYCAPSCDDGQCPSFSGSATPTCSDDALRVSRVATALRSPLDGRICSLVCNQSSDCPSGAICDDTICAWQSSSLRGSTNIVV